MVTVIMAEKTYHHKNLRNALIETGIHMMNESGIDGMSLRKIATACGVSSAAPYAHFSSKEDLIRSMQEYVTEEFMKRLEEAVAQCPHPDTEEVIVYMGMAYVKFFIEHPQYYKFLFYHEFMKVDLTLQTEDNFPPFEFLKSQVMRLHSVRNEIISRQEQSLEIMKLWSDVQGLASIASMKGVEWDQPWEETILNILCYHDRRK